MKYGILESQVNTCADNEIYIGFSAPLNVMSNQPVFVSDTISLKRVIASQNVQRWDLEVGLEPSNDSPNFLVHSVGNGYHRNIYIRMPQVFKMGKIQNDTYTIKVGAIVNKGASTIPVLGNSAKRIDSGEFINLGNDSKVYLVTKIDSTGQFIEITPSLRKPLAVNDTVRYGGKCTLRAKYDNTSQLGIKYTDGVLSDPGTVKFCEAV
jgi:hypothetical protein